jgi:hypothetical protein
MRFDANRLYELLPAVYRIRDSELASELEGQLTPSEEAELQLLSSSSQLTADQGRRRAELEEKLQTGPLKALLKVIAEQVAVLEENLDQLYDDQFIETCAKWVVPYIGDLVGARGVFVFPDAQFSDRAFVANTLSYRRRKGTAAIIEQLARDLTGWNANVVEYFLRLATTQYLNHIRPNHLSVIDLRNWQALESISTPFDSVPRTVDVRHIQSRRGKHNIPNVGVFLWRLGAFSVTAAPAFRVDARRYRFDALGKDTQLYNRPQTEKQITHLAEPINVPIALRRRTVDADLDAYYGLTTEGKLQSILLNIDGVKLLPLSDNSPQTSPPIPRLSDVISICDLSDETDSSGNVIGWIHKPKTKISIDPKLGRIAFPELQPPPATVHVTYHYGFAGPIGGGEYSRLESFSDTEVLIKVPSDEPDIQTGVTRLMTLFAGNTSLKRGAVEIEKPDDASVDHYQILGGAIDLPAGRFVEVRAAEKYRPIILLESDLVITGGAGSQLSLNGLLINSHTLRVPTLDSSGKKNELSRLSLDHCTLVPGPALPINIVELGMNLPASPNAPRSIVESANTTLEVRKSIVGPIGAVAEAQVVIANSIVDATSETAVAYGDPVALIETSPPTAFTTLDPGAPLELENTTVIGKVYTLMMKLASNTIFFSRVEKSDSWPSPVRAERLQQGCVRFSYVPPGSQLPRLFNCQPAGTSDAARVRPVFTSLRYGDAGYCQLNSYCPKEISSGADDQAEMGAFHDLFETQREGNLRSSLDEYLRFGLEAGILYAT